MYSMCQSKFEQMAKDAKAIYKVDKLVLVNCDILRNIWKHSDCMCDDFYSRDFAVENT